jgi:hypothetical protein
LDSGWLSAGAEVYKYALKRVELHMLNAGHFALETNAAEIGPVEAKLQFEAI